VEHQRERPLQGRLLPRRVLHYRVTLGGLAGRAFFPCVVDTFSQPTTHYNVDASLVHAIKVSRYELFLTLEPLVSNTTFGRLRIQSMTFGWSQRLGEESQIP
jgi:hypothetical protein